MLILAIDTAGRNGGVALARGDGHVVELMGSAALAGGMYSAELMPRIDGLLQQHKLALRDLDGFAVAAGPGSFTGLRVGLATVKGLAEIVERPIAAVSVLEAVAELAQAETGQFLPHGILFAALDAGRGEVYLAEFRVQAGQRELLREELVSREGLVAHVRGQEQGGAGPVVTPDSAIVEALLAGGLAAVQVAMPGAGDIARLGLAKLAAGDVVPAATLDANYIRRSDAEIFAAPGAKPTTETLRRGGK